MHVSAPKVQGNMSAAETVLPRASLSDLSHAFSQQ
jgi:hypothetical protein